MYHTSMCRLCSSKFVFSSSFCFLFVFFFSLCVFVVVVSSFRDSSFVLLLSLFYLSFSLVFFFCLRLVSGPSEVVTFFRYPLITLSSCTLCFPF